MKKIITVIKIWFFTTDKHGCTQIFLSVCIFGGKMQKLTTGNYLVNGGIKSLRWGFERVGVQAKFKLTINSKNFKMSGSYLKIKTPKCLVCKHK